MRLSLLTIGRLALAEARAYRARTIAAVLAVALGAGVLATALVLADTMRTAMRQGLQVQYAGTDVVVQGQIGGGAQDVSTGSSGTGSGIDPAAVAAIRSIRGVTDVASYTTATAVAQVGDVSRGITLDSLPRDPSFVWQGWAQGRPPARPDEVGLTRSTLDDLHIGLGDRVALGDTRVGRQVYTVVGVVDTRGALAYDSSAYGIVTPRVAQQFAGTTGPDVVLARTAPGTDVSHVVAAIDRRAPVGWPQSTSDLIASGSSVEGARADALGALVVGLAAVSLLVAAVTLATTTAASAHSQRRTLALARCIGADRGHLMLLVVLGVLLPSLGGAVIGAGIGIGLSRLLLPVVSLLPGVPHLYGGAFTVTPLDVLGPLGASAILALLAVIVPAWVASRIPPSAALSASGRADGRQLSALTTTLIAAALAGFGAWAALYGPSHGHLWLVFLGALLLLAGAGLTLAPVLALCGRWLRRFTKVPASRLALADIVRRPGAASTEAVALVVAVGVMAMSWVGLTCIAATTSARLTASPLPDLVIGAPAGSPVISAATQKSIAAIDGVAKVVPLRFGPGVTVEGRDAHRHVSLAVGTVAVDPEVLGRVLPGGFRPATLRADTVYLPKTSFPPFPRGHRVTLAGPDGRVRHLAVAYVDGLQVPSAVSASTMRRVSRSLQTRVLWVGAAAGADRAKVVDEVSGAAILGGELPVSGPLVGDVRIGKALDMARSASAAILAVAVLVAVVGAAATASLIVRERTREYAVMRALGLERYGLARLLFTRLLVVGSVGCVVGGTTGSVLGLMVGRAVAIGLGLPTAFRLPLLPVVLIAIVAVLLVRAAALIPLERASYTPPSRVLARD